MLNLTCYYAIFRIDIYYGILDDKISLKSVLESLGIKFEGTRLLVLPSSSHFYL
jgi:hypothetical protein